MDTSDSTAARVGGSSAWEYICFDTTRSPEVGHWSKTAVPNEPRARTRISLCLRYSFHAAIAANIDFALAELRHDELQLGLDDGVEQIGVDGAAGALIACGGEGAGAAATVPGVAGVIIFSLLQGAAGAAAGCASNCCACKGGSGSGSSTP